MLKAYLLLSLGLSSSFPREIASFHNHASGFRGRVNARPLHVQKLPFLGSRRSDSREQKQLYVQNGTGYPHQIVNEHGKRVDNAKSGEISGKNLPTYTAFSRGRSHIVESRNCFVIHKHISYTTHLS